MTTPNTPTWSMSSERWSYFHDLSRRKAASGFFHTADPLVAELQTALRSAVDSYMGARDAGWQYENTLHRIRETFAIHEQPPTPFKFYAQSNKSPIIGWRPHPFSARLDLAVTSTAMPPPPKCDICDQIQAAECHLAASQEKPA